MSARGGAADRLSARLSWLGLAMLAAAVLVGATNAAVVFPYWDLDPFISPAALIGVTPLGRAVLDLVMLLGAALAVLGAARVSVAMVGLWAVGVVVCVVHGIGDLEAARAGLTWSAALAAGVGCAHVAQEPGRRRVLGAVLLGAVALLAAKGAGQVFVEHPATVASFERDRASLLAARGWEEGSVSARLFERRLRQPEATGWFGLANVYASFAGALLVGFGGAAAAHLRLRGRSWAVAFGCACVAVLGGAMLVLAGSKGGWGAAVLGGGFVAAALLLPRKFAVLAAIGVVLAALGAVVVRGLAPIAPEAELSLLFRWYYMQGAGRAIAEHPWLGVSPTGFQDAYLLVKPALSPEQVSSPHSVLFDWVAAMGLGGLAWCGLLSAWLIGAGRAAGAGRAGEGDAQGLDRACVLALVGLVAVIGTVGTFLAAPAATPEGAVVRLLGLGGWIGFGLLVLRLPACALGVLLAGSAVPLAVHAQIEMTATWINAAGRWAALLGAGFAGRSSGADRANRATGASLRVGAAGVIGAAALVGAVGVVPATWVWEWSLRGAADEAATSARIDAGFAEASVAPSAADAEATLRRTAIEIGVGASPKIEQTAARLASARVARARAAIEGLERALAADPGHHPTRVALGRDLFRLAQLVDGFDPRERAAARARAVEVAEGGRVERPEAARAWAWAGRSVLLASERGVGSPARAIEMWERAAELDPRSLVHAVRLMDLFAELGDAEAAGDWARRALEVDEQHRLDPLSRLGEGERARAERIASGR